MVNSYNIPEESRADKSSTTKNNTDDLEIMGRTGRLDPKKDSMLIDILNKNVSEGDFIMTGKTGQPIDKAKGVKTKMSR